MAAALGAEVRDSPSLAFVIGLRLFSSSLLLKLHLIPFYIRLNILCGHLLRVSVSETPMFAS